MISIMACTKEANAEHPDIYKSLQMPEVQKSLPRFGSLRQGYNKRSFDEQ